MGQRGVGVGLLDGRGVALSRNGRPGRIPDHALETIGGGNADMNIKPIETQYKGYRFRSRLEARWAVFFDALGIEWQYEPEGYDLGEAGWYLPDFWLPSFNGGMFAEVKPETGDFTKAAKFCALTHQSIWLCDGTPSARAYDYLSWETWTIDEDSGQRGSGVVWHTGVPNWDSAYGDNRMYGSPGFDGEIPWDVSTSNSMSDSFLWEAIKAARSARFEHGETPSTGRRL